MNKIVNFLIAAPTSGTGKTTLTLGLLRAFKNRGLSVQPFKCGPDYIDTKFHSIAAGNPSVNLDLFLSSSAHVQSLYTQYAKGRDAGIVEGVMGLFDGYDKMNGSSAQIAQLLQLPVVLVVNAKAMAYSVAPLLYGFKHFNPHVQIAGVIFNFVGSESHYKMLVQACTDVGVQPLGYLPKNADVVQPSRHLGLSLDNADAFDAFAEKVAALVEKHIDLETLCEIARRDAPASGAKMSAATSEEPRLRIAVAQDEAFNFTYHENIAHFRRIGEVVFFSPLTDSLLPADIDLLYLPGGYPELFAEQLSENISLREQIKTFAEGGGKILAECGGMMYLSRSITTADEKTYPMVGVLAQDATMMQMRLRLGYRTFTYNKCECRGHEFHYSSVIGDLPSVVQQYDARGNASDTKLLRYKNVLAGYTHLYWGEMKNVMTLFDDIQQ